MFKENTTIANSRMRVNSTYEALTVERHMLPRSGFVSACTLIPSLKHHNKLQMVHGGLVILALVL